MRLLLWQQYDVLDLSQVAHPGLTVVQVCFWHLLHLMMKILVALMRINAASLQQLPAGSRAHVEPAAYPFALLAVMHPFHTVHKSNAHLSHICLSHLSHIELYTCNAPHSHLQLNTSSTPYCCT